MMAVGLSVDRAYTLASPGDSARPDTDASCPVVGLTSVGRGLDPLALFNAFFSTGSEVASVLGRHLGL